MAGWSRGCLRRKVGMWRGLDLAEPWRGWRKSAWQRMRGRPVGEMEEEGK